MKPLILNVFLLLTGTLVLGTKVRYDGYTLFNVIPQDEAGLEVLKNLESSSSGAYKFWSPVGRIGKPVQVLVTPREKKEFLEIMDEIDVRSEVLLEDVQEVIDREEVKLSKLRDDDEGEFGWEAYHDLDEINDWLASLNKLYPDIVTLLEGGSTYENRTILGVKVSYSPDNQDNAIWIDSNIHAREWITGAVNTYILNEVLTNQDEDFRKLVEAYDWYIFPVINPDGFAYTHTTDRMWRKTRVPYGEDDCVGADPNRNWAYEWNQGGASTNSCSETYNGPSPFSEPCTQTLSDFISTIAEHLKILISVHSYSQLLMVPYGYTTEKLDNYEETVSVALQATAALANRYGTVYTVGNIAETIYVASGNSIDWVKANYKTPFVYTYELRDTGTYGFLLPSEQIIPTAEETLDSVLVILREVQRRLNY